MPVELIVHGIGLGWFTAEYDSTPPPAETVITLATSFLVIAPLMTAMCIYALLDVADGRKPEPRAAIQRGLEVFTPVLLVIVLYGAGVMLGLLALVIPGLYLAIRWCFSIQAAVIDSSRGPEALRRSSELVKGSWWRVAGMILAANFLTGGLSAVVGAAVHRRRERDRPGRLPARRADPGRGPVRARRARLSPRSSTSTSAPRRGL